jgi:hypothetical protein
MLLQAASRFGAQLEISATGVAAELLKEVFREKQNVFATVTQRRQIKSHDR